MKNKFNLLRKKDNSLKSNLLNFKKKLFNFRISMKAFNQKQKCIHSAKGYQSILRIVRTKDRENHGVACITSNANGIKQINKSITNCQTSFTTKIDLR